MSKFNCQIIEKDCLEFKKDDVGFKLEMFVTNDDDKVVYLSKESLIQLKNEIEELIG